MYTKILFINKGMCRFKAMKEHESAKFERFGSFFFLLLFGIGLILPFVASLILCIAYGSFIRFIFYLDGKKIFMPTLLTNKIVSTKSGIAAEAVSKADTFVELLMTAKNRAQEGKSLFPWP